MKKQTKKTHFQSRWVMGSRYAFLALDFFLGVLEIPHSSDTDK